MYPRIRLRILAALLLVLGIVSACRQTMHVADSRSQAFQVDGRLDSLPREDALEATILPYRQQLQVKMGTVIGYVAEEMPKRQPESSLTHWLGDVMYISATGITDRRVDFGLMNYGGIRLPSLAAGQITVGKVYELMPFDNFVSLVDVPGAALQELFDMIAAAKGGWPVSSHVYLELKQGKAQNIRIGGRPLDPVRIYTVATSSFLADGGDGLKMLMQAPREDLPVMIRDAIIAHITDLNSRGEQIRSDSTGRMIRLAD